MDHVIIIIPDALPETPNAIYYIPDSNTGLAEAICDRLNLKPYGYNRNRDIMNMLLSRNVILSDYLAPICIIKDKPLWVGYETDFLLLKDRGYSVVVKANERPPLLEASYYGISYLDLPHIIDKSYKSLFCHIFVDEKQFYQYLHYHKYLIIHCMTNLLFVF